MPVDEFERMTEDLWQQVKPLYEQVHCYVRKQLKKKYGEERFGDDGLIPGTACLMLV
jgi:peptidyl-dipeptidase A